MSRVLFTTIDPLGNKIALLKETFEKHIIVRHPEMKNEVLAIKKAIETPFYIGQGTKDENSLIYLSRFKNNTKMPYLVVAVKFIKKFNKIILTAFGTKNLGLNKINKILWQQKKENSIIHTLQLPRS